MKRLVLAVVAVVLSAAMAFGAVQDFGKFTLNVASGWTAKTEGPSAIITKDDNTATLTITVDSAGGASAKDLAVAFAEECKKSYPKVGTPEVDEDGDYTWVMTNANGVDNHALLRVDDGDYMFITMAGLDTAGEDIAAMLDSVQDK